MKTTCPHCTTVFDLTPRLVTQSHGRVLCSVCNTTIIIDQGDSAQTTSSAHITPTRPTQKNILETTASATYSAESSNSEDLALSEKILLELTQRSIAQKKAQTPHRALWLTAMGLTLIALVLQVIHHHRDVIASSFFVGEPLRAIYSAIGSPIEPRSDLHRYALQQAQLTNIDGTTNLQLQTSIVNRATYSQPHPLLRVTLIDRFGTPLGRREFAAVDYLPGQMQGDTLIAPDRRVDIDLKLTDPGLQAVGFELDVCLYRKQRLHCANDSDVAGDRR
jgi:predicted Zn finger-like uncharacterized protein